MRQTRATGPCSIDRGWEGGNRGRWAGSIAGFRVPKHGTKTGFTAGSLPRSLPATQADRFLPPILEPTEAAAWCPSTDQSVGSSMMAIFHSTEGSPVVWGRRTEKLIKQTPLARDNVGRGQRSECGPNEGGRPGMEIRSINNGRVRHRHHRNLGRHRHRHRSRVRRRNALRGAWRY